MSKKCRKVAKIGVKMYEVNTKLSKYEPYF